MLDERGVVRVYASHPTSNGSYATDQALGREDFGRIGTAQLEQGDAVVPVTIENTIAERFQETMIDLFVERTDWTYYDRLTAATPDDEWKQVVDTIVERLDSRWDADTIVEIYLREERIEDAFETVRTARDLDLFEAHIDQLGEHDPAAYFDAYRRAIKKAAAEASRRKYYRQVAEHLQTIQTLGRDRRFENLVSFLREEYSNRPAFLDELEKAGF